MIQFIVPATLLAIFFLLLSMLSGSWLSMKGRPLMNGRFTLHKLISIAVFAILIYLFIQVRREWLPDSRVYAISIALLSEAYLLLLSGALLSFDRLAFKWIRLLHKFTGMLLLGTATAWFMLIQGITKG